MGLETRPPPDERPAPDASEAAPVENRAASPPAAPQTPAPTPTPNLPPIAAKADDLEAIRKAVDDAASVGGGLWLSYLFVLFYLGVAAGAVTHADLFLENPVKLPFLNVELPLLAFFVLAPILFVIVHAYTLVHLVMLAEKAKRYHRALHDPQRNITEAARENMQWQLPSNIFIQFLAGPRDLRAGAFGWLLRAIARTTLVIAPILLLLLMQVQFLPFHSLFITWTQRIVLVVDLLLIWKLWGRILAGRDADSGSFSSWPLGAIGLAFGYAAFVFSWLIATFPGEGQDNLPNQGLFWFPFPKPDKELVTLNRLVFQSDVDERSRRRRLPFSNTLVLTGFNIYEGLGIDDPDKLKWREFVFRERGRNLRGAILDFANLSKVDFTDADLQGASLAQAQLQKAAFEGAELQGASVYGGELQGATFVFAHLQGASLSGAQLQGAVLRAADLKGARLDGAHLQRCDAPGR